MLLGSINESIRRDDRVRSNAQNECYYLQLGANAHTTASNYTGGI